MQRTQYLSTPKQPKHYIIRQERPPFRNMKTYFYVYDEDGRGCHIGGETVEEVEDRLRAFELVSSITIEYLNGDGTYTAQVERQLPSSVEARMPVQSSFDRNAPSRLSDYETFPPHPQYGNIYFPYHIYDLGGLAYCVVDQQGEPITGRVCWVDAITVTQWLNNGERPPVVDIIVARSRGCEKVARRDKVSGKREDRGLPGSS